MKFSWMFFPLLLLAFAAQAQQDAATIRANCQAKLDALSKKISDLNDDYEQIKRDMKNGLYCSKCNSSKTELDKTEGFTKHLANVKGVAVPASQEQMDRKHQTYLNSYNSLKKQIESQTESCNTSIANANKERERKLQEDRDRQLRDQQAAIDKRNQDLANAAAAAEAKKQRDEAEKQRLLDEWKAKQEADRRAAQAEMLRSTQELGGMIANQFQEAGNRMKDNISKMKGQIDATDARYNGGVQNLPSSGYAQTGTKPISADDFDPESSVMDGFRRTYEKVKDFYESIAPPNRDIRSLGDEPFGSTIYDRKDIYSSMIEKMKESDNAFLKKWGGRASNVADAYSFSQDPKGFLKEYAKSIVTKQFPELTSWSSRITRFFPSAQGYADNLEFIINNGDNVTKLATYNLDMFFNESYSDEEKSARMEEAFRQYEVTFVQNLPVVGKLAKKIYTLKNWYDNLQNNNR
ncbi:hypothetical protein LX64_01729 [Chitinophaga skermanii]|uniref:Uncharacterized protein n=1 Tax=Chitinophaga skermanii TaxID=331697 RepID=A0A327QSD0_9BACT|nr:cell envelope integrity protein TolA [Chitinophaga skermanii]RAJ06602.1 hypothetical protein LX64_01729 [Chitinophaga skermanii]